MREALFQPTTFSDSSVSEKDTDKRQKMPRILKGGGHVLPSARFSPEPIAASVAGHEIAAPRVRLLKKGDIVEGVEVTCVCGQAHTLAFDYYRVME
ncbi:MAG: hypothetical protein FJY97_10850 [candidate division Zixibacteria bacterium]|nr:hypothetical protein [candidate division Zixibacteria bacterium]